METDNAGPGENLKLRLKGIEEEEILPGFILCNAENLCHSGRIFDAQVSVALHMWGKTLKVRVCSVHLFTAWLMLTFSHLCMFNLQHPHALKFFFFKSPYVFLEN